MMGLLVTGLRVTALLVTVCGSVAGCLPSRGSASGGGSAVGRDTTTVLSLERGACRGMCPIYTVRLAQDGRVSFTGARFVRAIGDDSAQVDASVVTALQAAFRARRFETLPSAITFAAPTCGAYVADLPTVELYLRRDSTRHRVAWDLGCRNHPPVLDTLAHLVDSLSGTARWITVPRP